jgi:hypothetical protein
MPWTNFDLRQMDDDWVDTLPEDLLRQTLKQVLTDYDQPEIHCNHQCRRNRISHYRYPLHRRILPRDAESDTNTCRARFERNDRGRVQTDEQRHQTRNAHDHR